MRLKTWIISGLFIGGLLTAMAYGYVTTLLHAAGPLNAEKTVFIEQGSSVHKIADILKSENVIKDAFVFKLGARMARPKGFLKAGEYMIPVHVSMSDMINILQEGKVYQRKITFAEGLTVYDIMHILNEAEAMTGEITPADLSEEGSLLPETYSYSHGDDRHTILKRMQTAQAEFLNTLWENRADDLPLKTPREAVTLASIVEKETGIKAEREKVAGVFINRLKINMALQSDPTVIYAVTQGKQKLVRPIYRKDLNTDSPYNTYKVTGLPPTPIANPGKASLKAVFNPEKHNFFFFVADGTGGHVFTQTLGEHLKKVGDWRKIEKKRKKEK